MSKKILIVEDFEDSRELMKFLLKEQGYDVLEASDGWNAVEAVKREIPDLIFMDMALPRVDGITATRIIRQIEEASHIPIIALTASGQFIQNQALEAGCNDFITKPLDIDKLQPVIEQYLNN